MHMRGRVKSNVADKPRIECTDGDADTDDDNERVHGLLPGKEIDSSTAGHKPDADAYK